MLPQTIQWIGDETGFLQLIDQTRLPQQLTLLDCNTPEETWHAIKRLSVRGAPAIGIAAAYGVVLALQDDPNDKQAAQSAIEYLATSRPTAVNLFWALDRIKAVVEQVHVASSDDRPKKSSDTMSLAAAVLAEARAIHDEDRECCHRIGQFGADLLDGCSGVLTHCNAGGLATSEYGTALAAIYEYHKTNPAVKVYADETRPLLQGARLTAWELHQSGIDVTVICDSMAAQVMRERRVQAVIVGADRIAANGDAANKIGTYQLAIAAKYHGIPFYVAAPLSTFDLSLKSGAEIPIEQRAAEEVSQAFGLLTVPLGVSVYNPAFDVTPASLITAIITDAGVIDDVSVEGVAAVCKSCQLQ